MTLSTQPPKGTQDRYPDEFRVRNHIFQARCKVCKSFGYEEYLAPLVEHTAIWEAKSGEDVGGSELTRITDREGKISDLALRPEMTPSVTRMVSKVYPQLSKPVRWFSIANFYRNERPQRGRNREFWQLNVDLFGDTGEQGLLEILQMAMELMIAFDGPKDSRSLALNHRGLINAVLESLNIDISRHTDVVRTMDKWSKLSREKFEQILTDHGLSVDQIVGVIKFMTSETMDDVKSAFPDLVDHDSVSELFATIEQLTALGYGDYLRFQSSLMRGFDYYDGIVFEVFDHHPDNNRALFGGGRYDGLADIFGVKESISAIGFAPGDETMKLFLESRGMLDAIQEKREEKYYLPVLEEDLLDKTRSIAARLRKEGKSVIQGFKVQKLGKALQYAEKQSISHVAIVWSDELKIKNMKTGEELSYSTD